MTQGAAAELIASRVCHRFKVAWGDIPAMHEIRDLAGLPHRAFLTQGLVLGALGKHAKRKGTKLVCIGHDCGTGGSHYGLAGHPYMFHRPVPHAAIFKTNGSYRKLFPLLPMAGKARTHQ